MANVLIDQLSAGVVGTTIVSTDILEIEHDPAGTPASKKATLDDVFALRLKGCRAFNSADISIPDATLTALTFDSEDRDDGACHSTASNTGRLVAPVTGWYAIVANVAWHVSAVGARHVYIKLNGSTYIGDSIVSNAGAGTGPVQIVTTLYYLTATDYVEVIVYQDSGGALLVKNALNASPYFMFKLL